MSAECFIWVDNCHIWRLPAYFTSFGLLIPEWLGKKEVVVLYLSVVIGRRNVEIGRSSTEVIVHSISFSSCWFPGGMIIVSIEGVLGICPSILKSFDRAVVIFLSHGNNKIFILNGSSIFKSDWTFTCIDLLNTYSIRWTDIFIQKELDWWVKIELCHSAYYIIYSPCS